MESRVNYTAVGLFVVVLLAALVAIFFWLSTSTNDEHYSEYVIYLREEVSGLSIQGAVRYNGVPVGHVKSITLVPSNPRLVKVMVNIKTGTPVNTSTVATLMSQGITGVDYIGLQSERVNAPPLTTRKDEQYPIIPSKPSLLMQLSEVLPEITRKVSQLSDSVSKVFDENNRLSVKKTLANLDGFTATLNKNAQTLTAVMRNLKQLTARGADASKALPGVMTELDRSLKSVQKAANTFAHVSHSAESTLDSSRLAINGVSQQLVPTTQQLLQHLNNMATNLQGITNQLQRNPSMFIRGRVPTSPGPGEK